MGSPCFYKLFQFKADLAALLKRYCCHRNVTYKFTLTKIRLLACFSIQINLLNCYKEYYYCSDILFKLCIFCFIKKCREPP